jgi:rubrerythrin
MPKTFFNEIEAAMIAQNMEKHGLEFYQRAAARAKDTATRDLFLRLAEDEKKHLARFEELEEILQADRRAKKGYTDDADLAAYIDRLVETQVFADEGTAARLADQARSDYEALAVAIRAERDSILFYQEMMSFIESNLARAAFSTILDEERAHLRILGDQSEHCENFQA